MSDIISSNSVQTATLGHETTESAKAVSDFADNADQSPHHGDQVWLPGADFEMNLDWLMDFDSTVDASVIDSMDFDQHLWPAGL